MCHDSYLPSSPTTPQALDRMEYAMVNAIAPPDVRIIGPHFNVSSHSPSVPGYIQKFDPWVPPCGLCPGCWCGGLQAAAGVNQLNKLKLFLPHFLIDSDCQ